MNEIGDGTIALTPVFWKLIEYPKRKLLVMLGLSPGLITSFPSIVSICPAITVNGPTGIIPYA